MIAYSINESNKAKRAVDGLHRFLRPISFILFYGAVAILAIFLSQNLDAAVTFIKLNNNTPGPVDVAYHPGLQKLVTSVNWPSGSPHNFVTVDSSGTTTPISGVSGLTGFVPSGEGEVKFTTVPSGSTVFTAGDIFAGSGAPGEIARISADGSVVQRSWCVLRDSGKVEQAGILGLHIDTTTGGAWGNQLIVVATKDADHGSVWKVDANGNATLIARVPSWLEGVTTVPTNSIYGDAAGAIIAGSGDNDGSSNPGMWVIPPTGSPAVYNVGFDPEDLHIAVSGEDFYIASVGDQMVYRVQASDLPPWSGQIIGTTEGVPGFSVAGLSAISWNGTSFTSQSLGTVPTTEFEHGCFAPIQVTPVSTLVNIIATDALATEGDVNDRGRFHLTRSGNISSSLTVNFTKSTGTGFAVFNVDYTLSSGATSVIIPAGDDSVDIIVTALDDAANDPNEKVTLTLASGTGYTIGSPSVATVNIGDPDTSNSITIVATDPNAAETPSGDFPDEGTFTIIRAGNLTSGPHC